MGSGNYCADSNSVECLGWTELGSKIFETQLGGGGGGNKRFHEAVKAFVLGIHQQ